MNRITKKFIELKVKNKIAFMPFIVAGDPSFESSIEIVKKLTKSADCLEIGLPYSDPLADGPTIQAADQRAIDAGMNTDRAFEFVRNVRLFTDIPITLLVYANAVLQYGINEFYAQAKKSGVDGILVPDLPIEEADPFIKAAQSASIDPIFLVAQTTTDKRLEKILEHAKGYLYLVAVLGTTGERDTLDPKILSLIKQVKRKKGLPAVVGFGISKVEHIAALKEVGADGFIVGSALIKIIEKNLGRDEKMIQEINEFVKILVGE
ncbi:tryptophan synthase subunit alpha [bacterium]|nr:tryptophan synthase subunit alpha [bacterium]